MLLKKIRELNLKIRQKLIYYSNIFLAKTNVFVCIVQSTNEPFVEYKGKNNLFNSRLGSLDLISTLGIGYIFIQKNRVRIQFNCGQEFSNNKMILSVKIYIFAKPRAAESTGLAVKLYMFGCVPMHAMNYSLKVIPHYTTLYHIPSWQEYSKNPKLYRKDNKKITFFLF